MNIQRPLLLSLAMLSASSVFAEWGQTPRLTVVGNHLEDPDGNQVMLHGVMDTPSPYFSGYRFTDGNWIDVYKDGDRYITKCKDYFDKLFTAVTDTAQGSWCNVFRLHLDPCWTNNPNVKAKGFTEKNGKLYDPNGTEVSGEASVYNFSKTRLSNYLRDLYLPLAKLAQKHGMYVIMRPPGVCPRDIKVGDYYQEYLTTVWDIVSKDADLRSCSDWLSIELANEPVNVYGADGRPSNAALHDFFQPIVNKIRENGFNGIIWVPGASWQQNYGPYVEHPMEDPQQNMGYAVHWYPGWYNTSDTSHDAVTSVRSFLSSVPVVKDYPVMITEVDWSPEDPNGVPHKNEYGQDVIPNCGTWATGSTSKFGEAFKATLEYFDNIGMTLTHTHDYIDIDHYLKTNQLLPAFHNKLSNQAYEACSGACFEWYSVWAKTEHEARSFEQETANEMFPLDELHFNPSIWETGSYDASTHTLTTGQYGFGGWKFNTPLDLSKYKYLVIEFNKAVPGSGQWAPSFRMFDENNYWTACTQTLLGGKTSIAIELSTLKKEKDGVYSDFDPSHVYIAGFWTTGGAGNSVSIKNIFVSDDGLTPALSLEELLNETTIVTETFNLNGLPATEQEKGLLLQKDAEGKVRKVFVK